MVTGGVAAKDGFGRKCVAMRRWTVHAGRPEWLAWDPWLVSLLLLWALWLAHGWRAGRESAEPPTPRAALSTIDPNTAPWWELTVLPGIGEQRARGIVAFREAARESDTPAAVFRSAEDLAPVHGIGPRTVEGIKPHLRFAGE